MELELRIKGSVEDLNGILRLLADKNASPLPAGSFTWHDIHQPTLKPFPYVNTTGHCIDCGCEIQRASNAQKRCGPCKEKAKKETWKKHYHLKKQNQENPDNVGGGTSLTEKLKRIRQTCPSPKPRPSLKRDFQ